jgi:hypothetical protein
MTPENQLIEAYYSNHWSKFILGVRVDGDTVVIKAKSNDGARQVCQEILHEMKMRSENNNAQ